MFGLFSTRVLAEDNSLKEQLEKLRGIVLKNSRPSDHAAKAVAYCEYCIRTYEDWFDWNEGKWLLWQKVVIIGGVVATFAGVITLPHGWIVRAHLESFGWLRGVPAGIVTIAAGYLASFTYREDAVRHELTANALMNELAKYQGHAHPYDIDEAEDTSAFLNKICLLVENELHSWGALVSGNRTEKSHQEDRHNSTGNDPPPHAKQLSSTPPPTMVP